MLDIKSARKVFYKGQPDEKIALNGLTLSLKAGEFGVVIGSNGAGKSSMLNAISGALSLDSGQVLINGNDVTNMPVHKRAARLARVFQDPMKGTAASMTVGENMLLAELRGIIDERGGSPFSGSASKTGWIPRLNCFRAVSASRYRLSWQSAARPTCFCWTSTPPRSIRAPPISSCRQPCAPSRR